MVEIVIVFDLKPCVPKKVAHNGLYTIHGAEKNYRNDIDPVIDQGK